jgi:hypothetical protein
MSRRTSKALSDMFGFGFSSSTVSVVNDASFRFRMVSCIGQWMSSNFWTRSKGTVSSFTSTDFSSQ